MLLILPQDPNNRSSAAQTIEDAVCASPRITTSYNSPVEKVPEDSEQRFGLVDTDQRGLEENAATCKEDGTSGAVIPNIMGHPLICNCI